MAEVVNGRQNEIHDRDKKSLKLAHIYQEHAICAATLNTQEFQTAPGTFMLVKKGHVKQNIKTEILFARTRNLPLFMK